MMATAMMLLSEHQTLTPSLFGPNEHVAVTDHSLQQGVRLCLVDDVHSHPECILRASSPANTSAVPWNKRLMKKSGSQTLIEVIYLPTGAACVELQYIPCSCAIRH